MKVVILGTSGLNGVARQYLSSYLINQSVAVDAGCLGFHSGLDEQEAVRHLFLTHSHADHIASLPLFFENVWSPERECPTLYGGEETLAVIRRCVFNDDVWPDLVALSERMHPFLRMRTLEPEVAVVVDGLKVTPVPVHHVVPAFAYVVEGPQGAVIFGADSGPTARLWEVAHQIRDLRAVFLEATFPNRLRSLAEVSLHLTPDMVRREVAKLPQHVRVIVVHVKVRYRDEVCAELRELGLPQIEIGECEREYVF